MKLKEEAIAMFSGDDNRSFDEIYKGREDLFEEVDDMIDPRMRKLFESTYKEVNGKRLQEGFKDSFEFGEPTAWEDRYSRVKNRKPTTYADAHDSSLGKGVKGGILKEIKNSISVFFNICRKAQIDAPLSAPDGRKILELYRDVKFDRKTPRAAANALMGPVAEGTIKDQFFSDQGGMNDELKYGWSNSVDTHLPSGLSEFGNDYNDVRHRYGEFAAAFQAPVRFVAKAIFSAIRIATGFVTVPRDVIAGFKAAVKGGKWTKAEDFYKFRNAYKEVIAALFEAAVKVDSKKDPLAEKRTTKMNNRRMREADQATLMQQAAMQQQAMAQPGAQMAGMPPTPTMGAVPAPVPSQCGTKDELTEGLIRHYYENCNSVHNFSGCEGGPDPDGVPAGHNRPGMNGEDHEATQGQGRGMSNNAKIFESIYMKSKQPSQRRMRESEEELPKNFAGYANRDEEDFDEGEPTPCEVCGEPAEYWIDISEGSGAESNMPLCKTCAFEEFDDDEDFDDEDF